MSEGVAEVIIATGRAVSRALPPRVLRRVEDRLMYAIFQKTRVENDAYGWKPPAPGGERSEGTEPPSGLAPHPTPPSRS